MNSINIQKNIQNRGAALLIFIIFFLATSLSLMLAIGTSVYDGYAAQRALFEGKKSFYAAEAGVEDAIHRHRDGKSYSHTESFTIDSVSVSAERTVVLDTFEILVTASINGYVRRSKVVLEIGDGASFNFGLQSGNGGIEFRNSSSVQGNVFSNGIVDGASNYVYGDIISAGPGGRVQNMRATASVWSNTITGGTIGGNAYYQSLTGTLVRGSSCTSNPYCFPGSPDQDEIGMPIPDSQIEEWKENIRTTGTVIASTSPQCSGGTYTINSDTTLGNVRIECNLVLRKQGASTNITIDGPIWVEGNLLFDTGPNIIAAPSLGNRSVQIIVDKEDSRETSSTVSINNTTTFTSSDSRSYVFIVSMNESAKNGGVVKAIDLGQTVTGKLLVYAPHGLIEIGQSTSLREVTGYKIRLINSAEVIYESGLANLLFSAGPGGGFVIASWREV